MPHAEVVDEGCGQCGAQGLPLNQYPAVRPQFPNVPPSLEREEWLLSVAASLTQGLMLRTFLH